MAKHKVVPKKKPIPLYPCHISIHAYKYLASVVVVPHPMGKEDFSNALRFQVSYKSEDRNTVLASLVSGLDKTMPKMGWKVGKVYINKYDSESINPYFGTEQQEEIIEF